VFLGRALEKQGQLHPAVDAYKAATKLKPEEDLAWKGLIKACEALGAQGVEGHTAASSGLAQVYAEKWVARKYWMYETDFEPETTSTSAKLWLIMLWSMPNTMALNATIRTP